ncbi:MAG: cobalamin biosynthesis protein CbiD, partial [Verrucomicrobia bacterium]|nr:cobalamin biosynthesis protein CbiD [Verrucomicrobiota bacterium]
MNAVDLSIPAANGLRRGFTTGTCATAAVKAALVKLLRNETVTWAKVTFPDHDSYLAVPIASVHEESGGAVRADVIKDAGDDPDQTHRARLFARVRPNGAGRIVFRRGEGVGLVTQPGLAIPAGEPAINPIPRQMMLEAVHETLAECDWTGPAGFDLEIGCENGEEIARRTFNPRLGIQGGISILGTTGIVEPKSMAAFKASIEIYVRVALGDNPPEIVLAPGNLGQRFARRTLDLPIKRVVQMSNFFGFALDCVQRTLLENRYELPRLWVIGHPGKLAKALDGVWDTHSSRSESAVGAVARVAEAFGDFSRDLVSSMRQARTVESIIG